MGRIFQNLIRKHNRRIPFVILTYFLATFILVRILVYGWTYGIIPEISLTIDGVEIHHFNFGIFILVLVGYWLLVKEVDHFKIAKFYGIGLALAFDEFGMWLHLKDDYWIRQSYDGIIVITAILLNIVYLGNIWQKIIDKNVNLIKRIFRKTK